MEWIADSWRPLSPGDDEGADAEPADLGTDDAIDPEAFAREQTIREIVASCVAEELPAETIRLSILGLCRSLGALSQLAADESQHKGICMEAAGVMAVTSSCERMLRSVSGFSLIRGYRFVKGQPPPD